MLVALNQTSKNPRLPNAVGQETLDIPKSDIALYAEELF